MHVCVCLKNLIIESDDIFQAGRNIPRIIIKEGVWILMLRTIFFCYLSNPHEITMSLFASSLCKITYGMNMSVAAFAGVLRLA